MLCSFGPHTPCRSQNDFNPDVRCRGLGCLVKPQPPPGIRAHIHPDLFPYGNIEDGTIDEVVAAENWLRDQGCTYARGPMGPTTWHPYRAVVESDGRPAFLGETEFSPCVWEARGYSMCAHYASALAPNAPQIESAEVRSESLRSAGWVLMDLQEIGVLLSSEAAYRQLRSQVDGKARDVYRGATLQASPNDCHGPEQVIRGLEEAPGQSRQ